MMEELNLVCMDLYASKAQTGNVDISMSDVYNKLTNDMEVKRHVYPVDGTSTIRLVDTTQSSVTMLNDGEAIGSDGEAGKNTVTIELDEESNSTSYYLEANGKYYPMSIRNLQVALDEENATTTPPTGAGSLGSGLTIKFIDSGTSEETDTSSYVEKSLSETTLTLKARANTEGSTQVVVKDGEVTLAGNIGVEVKPTYTITTSATASEGSIVITTSGKNTTDKTKYGKDVEITLTATGNQGYAFEKWNDESTKNPRPIQVSSTTAGTYTATFVEALTYGRKTNIGTITVGSTELTAKWRYFYEDEGTSGNIYLMYGDYLPNGAIPASGTISKTGYSVYSSSGGDDLVAFLTGTGSYTNAWNNLNNAVKAVVKTKLIASGATEANANIAVAGIVTKGAAKPEQWMKSYNENYETNLEARYFTSTGITYYNSSNSDGSINTTSARTTSAPGYLYTRDNTESTIKWEDALPYNYISQLSGFPTGSSNMYYPHTSKVSQSSKETWGYWLAGPTAASSDFVCCVRYLGMMDRNKFSSDSYGVCPIVSIPKSSVVDIKAALGI